MWSFFRRLQARATAEFALKWCQCSEAAGYRTDAESNQDEIAVFSPWDNANCYVCLLTDGAGGRPGGKEAAKTAVQACREQIISGKRGELSHSRFWEQVVKAADKKVAANEDAGFTTLIALGINKGLICGASCGDSAVLLVRQDGTFKTLTEQQHKNPPVGSSSALPISFTTQLLPGDRLLLMSDGVFRYLGMETIAETVRAHEDIRSNPPVLRKMQTATSSGQLTDDFSLIIVSAE